MEEMSGRSSFSSAPLVSAQSLSLDCLLPFVSRLPACVASGWGHISQATPGIRRGVFIGRRGGHLWPSLDVWELQSGLLELAPWCTRWVAWTPWVV